MAYRQAIMDGLPAVVARMKAIIAAGDRFGHTIERAE